MVRTVQPASVVAAWEAGWWVDSIAKELGHVPSAATGTSDARAPNDSVRPSRRLRAPHTRSWSLTVSALPWCVDPVCYRPRAPAKLATQLFKLQFRFSSRTMSGSLQTVSTVVYRT